MEKVREEDLQKLVAPTRLVLGKAAVLEGIRRCGVLGATLAYVGSDLPIYQSVSFRKVYNREC